MKTYPINRKDGTLHAFEICNTWIAMGTIKRILSSVPGVSDVQRNFFSDKRLAFKFNAQDWVVWEPWGDSSSCWIGPKDAENHKSDVTPIYNAFNLYQFPLIKVWNKLVNAQNS